MFVKPSSVVLNPTAPFGFLPEDMARQLAISTYILVASSAIFVWDLLNGILDDIRMVRSGLAYPTVIYFGSRLTSLGYVVGSTILETAPLGHCMALQRIVNWLYFLAIPLTSALFLLRIRAIFTEEKGAVFFFGAAWTLVLASSLAVPFGGSADVIGSTSYCMVSRLHEYISVAVIVPFLYDTLVFVAITLYLVQNMESRRRSQGGLRSLVSGVNMPDFSRSILRGGQLYYLTTSVSNVLTLTILSIQSAPTAYRTMFMVPNVMLINTMASRVFRDTFLDRYRVQEASRSNEETPTSPGPPQFASLRRSEDEESDCGIELQELGHSEGDSRFG
ncbi:hypothetical protein CPC08DRAFT_634197 [Agrocybe pediades]|nr:hypothetical protein CPC08DRAFT_634197 [Agrocybe pediades]